MPKDRPQSSALIKIVSYLFLASFAIFMLLAVVAVRNYRLDGQRVAYEQGFIPIEAEVTQQEQIASSEGVSIVTHYKFTPPGSAQSFLGKDKFESKLYLTQADAEAEVQRRGRSVKVYYHPDNPGDSSRQPPAELEEPSRLLLGFAIFFICSAGVTGVFRVLWDRYWKHRDVAAVNVGGLLAGLATLTLGTFPLLISVSCTALVCYDFMIAGLEVCGPVCSSPCPPGWWD